MSKCIHSALSISQNVVQLTTCENLVKSYCHSTSKKRANTGSCFKFYLVGFVANELNRWYRVIWAWDPIHCLHLEKWCGRWEVLVLYPLGPWGTGMVEQQFRRERASFLPLQMQDLGLWVDECRGQGRRVRTSALKVWSRLQHQHPWELAGILWLHPDLPNLWEGPRNLCS